MNRQETQDKEIEEWIEQSADMLYRIAIQQLQQKEDAEDVVQEILIKAFMHRHEFSDYEHAKAWMIRGTVNQCHDLRRLAWFKKRDAYHPEKYEQTPVYNTEQSEVIQALKVLSPSQRTVIYLYYYEGYKIAEISSILGKRENTVSSLLRRGRLKLKDYLTEEGGIHETI